MPAFVEPDLHASGSALAAFARHGGNLALARQLFPDAPAPWLDLSTGLNPRPYPVPDLPAEAWTRLPDGAALADLEAVAARAYGVGGAEAALAGPGTEALIRRLPEALGSGRDGDVRILGPLTYGGHAAAWTAAGARVATVETIDALAGAAVAVVVNPNNPDGRRIAPACLRDLAGRLAAGGGVLVVDEAFADGLGPEASLLPGGVPGRTVVLRSFGKMFGLGGVRLGFLFGAPGPVGRVRDALGAWPVSGPAIAIGTTALADLAWLDAARARLHRDAAALDGVLAEAGWHVLGGTPLFRLAHRPDAAAAFGRLARAGILTRPFTGRSMLRFGLPGDRAGLDRLRDALR